VGLNGGAEFFVGGELENGIEEMGLEDGVGDDELVELGVEGMKSRSRALAAAVMPGRSRRDPI
jgi:hypothetical protein